MTPFQSIFLIRGVLAAASIGLVLVGKSVTAQTVIWSGADATGNVNTNWSDASNWMGGIPGAATNIYFFDEGAASGQGVVNNIVDGNTKIFSLQYGNTNGFHTTQIKAGVTLTVSNTAADILVYVGTGTDNGVSQISHSIITGPGAFTAADTNSGSMFVVQQGSANTGSHMATLNLSGLANFNLTMGQLIVGGANPGSAGADNWLAGTFYLAETNNIRVNGVAPAIDVGDCINNGATSYFYLGQTNAIFADSVTIAHSKATSTLAFNPALAGSNPTLSLNGNTNSRVTTLSVGDFSPQTGSSSTTVGTIDWTAGTVNARVDTCYVGRGQGGNGSGPSTGTLILGPGVLNVNTLNVGYASASSAVGTVTGTVEVTNGTLVVNGSLLLGYNAGSIANTSGTLSITNGTVLANSISTGGGTCKINLNGGLLAVSNMLGTVGAPLNALTISNGAVLEFWVANNFTNAATKTIASDSSGVIDIGALPVVLSYPSKYPLIYCPSGGANGVKFSVGTLPGIYQGYISNDNSSMVWLVVTNGPTLPKTDQWAGSVNQNWDTNTLNWTSNGVPVSYSEEDFVLFNDTAQTGAVSVVGTPPHAPYSWTVSNNVLNYTFSGTNAVSGMAGLFKYGTGSLMLSESGDSFSGGITVSGGTVVLDEASNTISGGLIIASGATVQVGNNDTNGSLPSGTISDNGTLVFDRTNTALVTSTVSGGGGLMQAGRGILELAGTNTYTGSTLDLEGTLALTNGGLISASANVVVSNATLDVSGVGGVTTLNNLNMTNGAINLASTALVPTPVNVANLNLGGSSNTINITTLPGFLFYPTNVTLIMATNGIHDFNLDLGKLPTGSPSYAGSVSQKGNSVLLTLTGGPLAVVQATVTYSPTNPGLVLNPAFVGLSYEKSELTGNLFMSSDTSLVSMFSQIAPAVLRVGGNSVNTTCWGGVSNQTPITAAEVSAFAGFVKSLPTNWHVIYGINASVNSPTNCAAEAAYVANALGSSLLGFEVGNEPDLYYENGLRTSSYTFANFLSEWRAFAAGITNTVPGWAITNGGSGWTLTGPASADNTTGYTVPFAGDEAGTISMVTQHYYRANGQSPSSTIQLLLQPDAGLPGIVTNIVKAAIAANLPMGFRMDECGSFYNGGAPNVSDAYGTALWAIDYLFTLALNGCQGMNFHGGGGGTGYTPIADNGTSVVQARPEFYGLKMFSLVSQGNVIPATVSLSSNLNFTAYGVRRTNGAVSAVLNNKDTNNGVLVTVKLGVNVTAAQLIQLTGPTLNSTNGYTLGGAVINPNGSWAGGVQMVIPATNGQVTVMVPPISVDLLNPVVAEGTNLLLANDAQNTSSWTGSTNWSDGLAPHTGANYFTVTNLLRTPASTSAAFAGDSLTIGPSVLGNTSLRLKFNAPGGILTINNCTNTGGIIDAGTASTTNYISGTNWVVAAPGGFGLSGDNTRTIILTNINLSGSATLSNGVVNGSGYTIGGLATNGLGTVVYAGNAVNFTGPIVTSLGTTLQAYSQTNLGGSPATFQAAQLVLDNGIFQPLASMALNNANSGVTINPDGGTFNVGTGLALTIANPIAGSGAITNSGGGVLTLSGANTLTGPIFINAGGLALTGSGSIASAPIIAVAGGAKFDVSGLGSTFVLDANQALSNSTPSAVIAGTNSTGAGTIALMFDGANPSLVISNGGMTLSSSTVFMVNNTGAPLAVGGAYKVIAKAPTGNAGLVAGTVPISVTVGGNGAAGPASLQISGGELYVMISPNLPAGGTNLLFNVSGNQLDLSWPSNYTGWLLQSNAAGLAMTNEWFTVPGSVGTDYIQILMSPGQSNVFYRMAHP